VVVVISILIFLLGIIIIAVGAVAMGFDEEPSKILGDTVNFDL